MRRSGFWHSKIRSTAMLAIVAAAGALACSPPVPAAADPGAKEAAGTQQRVRVGAWGGEHIRMDVGASGAALEFDCAFGRIDEPLITDSDGNFRARGVVMFEAGGPVQPGQSPPQPQAAIYQGSTDGLELRLTVTILAKADWQLGTFTLGFGRRAVLEKCL
jgi:hypothetical protein